MEINLTSFYFSLIAIAIIILLGFFLGKIHWVSDATNKQLVNLLLMVFMPITLLNAFPAEYSDAYRDLFLQGVLGGAIIMPTMIILARLIYRKKFFPGALHDQSQFAFIFNNATFLGYPIISLAFGPQGVVPYCGFIIVFNFALFSYGVWLFQHKLNAKFIFQTITNPNIIAVILGLIIFLFRLNLPVPVASAVGYLGAVTTPLSLICIGFMLSTAKLRDLLKNWKLFIIAAVQLILAPLVTFGLLSLLQLPREVVAVCTLIQALPTATSLGLFAEKYGGARGAADHKSGGASRAARGGGKAAATVLATVLATASELVVISTFLSALTLPLVSLIFL